MQSLLYTRILAESFLEPNKSQDPCRHKPKCIMYMKEKGVGPVGAMAVGHFLIQRVQGRYVVEVQGAMHPESLRILYFSLLKMVKNNKIVPIF